MLLVLLHAIFCEKIFAQSNPHSFYFTYCVKYIFVGVEYSYTLGLVKNTFCCSGGKKMPSHKARLERWVLNNDDMPPRLQARHGWQNCLFTRVLHHLTQVLKLTGFQRRSELLMISKPAVNPADNIVLCLNNTLTKEMHRCVFYGPNWYYWLYNQWRPSPRPLFNITMTS